MSCALTLNPWPKGNNTRPYYPQLRTVNPRPYYPQLRHVQVASFFDYCNSKFRSKSIQSQFKVNSKFRSNRQRTVLLLLSACADTFAPHSRPIRAHSRPIRATFAPHSRHIRDGKIRLCTIRNIVPSLFYSTRSTQVAASRVNALY